MLEASTLHRITDDQAIALVDQELGGVDEQGSALLQYRWASDWQADWKAEVGHWLATARRVGCLASLVQRCRDRQRSREFQPARLANDPHHKLLMNELAPAAVLHYLDGTGWGYRAWDKQGPGFDHDIELTAPGGLAVAVQVKNPDQPGEVVNHRRVDGENDAWVTAAIDNAAEQLLPEADPVNVIAVVANRVWPLTSLPAGVIAHVMGSCVQTGAGSGCVLPRARWGAFSAGLRHVDVVLILDLIRGPERRGYGAIALLNPWARHPAHAAWFPEARVCHVEDGVVLWTNGVPRYGALPDGTRLVEAG